MQPGSTAADHILFSLCGCRAQQMREVRERNAELAPVRKAVSNKAMVTVMQGYRLPAVQPQWMHLRFRPEDSTSKRSRRFFSDEADFRDTMTSLIEVTCDALDAAMDICRWRCGTC